MGNYYNRLKQSNIDLSALGLYLNEEYEPYFCTPKGAQMVGNAGVDGIHCCHVRGFGEAVFAVSPMNLQGEWVHPVAVDFKDFLRLMAACGDFAAIEQAWSWTEKQFNAFIEENAPGEEQRRVIAELNQKLGIEPMKNPYEYIHSVQNSFDYTRIRYSDEKECGIEVEKVQKIKHRVYYDGGWNCGQGHQGREMKIERRVRWQDEEWYIPSLYICAKGVVADICVGIESDRVKQFADKWGITAESDCDEFSVDKQMIMYAENPLNLHIDIDMTINGRKVGSASGLSTIWMSGVEDENADYICKQYKLDENKAWVLMRYSFPWSTKRRPEIKSNSLALSGDKIEIPAARFTVSKPDEVVEITHPENGQIYTLKVVELMEKCANIDSFDSDMEYPNKFRMMTYKLNPEADIKIIDASTGDFARAKNPNNAYAVALGVIGGADGPTAVFVTDRSVKSDKTSTACSSTYFELPEKTEWIPVFTKKVRGEITLPLV